MNTRKQPDVINVAVIGCGLIGAQWDHPDTALEGSLTHAAAFSRNAASRLIALCDIDQVKAETAAKRWGCPAVFSSPQQLFNEARPDLVVIATSSTERWSVIDAALVAGVRCFVIEKPLAATLAESKRLVAALDAAGARTIVNFSRRWDPSMHLIREKILTGAFGDIQRFVGLYGKGIVNNGSHMIDLVSNLCDARAVKVRSLGSPLPVGEAGWSKNGERAPDAQIIFRNSAGQEFRLDLLGTDQSAFTCFELKVIGRDAICEILRGGRHVQMEPVLKDPNYPDYRIPGPPVDFPAHAIKSMDMMAAEAIELTSGRIDRARCDIHMAMSTAMTVEAIKRASLKEGMWTDVEIDDSSTTL